MKFILITNSIQIVEKITASNIRIMIDLELIGKKERQKNRDTFITTHVIEDIARMRSAFPKHEIMVRVNPLNSTSSEEIESVLSNSVDLIMLPMLQSSNDVESFSDLVRGRAGLVPLIETFSSFQDIHRIAGLNSVREVYLGLNDLHIDMKMDFMFEVLSRGFVDEFANVAKKNQKPFGFGGVSVLGTGTLPADDVLAEHVRMGSSRVILSRSFHSFSDNIEYEINRLNDYLCKLKLLGESDLFERKQVCFEKIGLIAKSLRA
jgi:hypothetical protein